jgi:uncharacterized protein YggE
MDPLMIIRMMAGVFLSGAALFGQFQNGISQSVSRAVTVTPDQAAFSVSVDTTSETTLETVLGILKKVEITAKDLVGQGVDLYYTSDLQNHYDFTFTVAPGRMQEVAKTLNAVRKDLPAELKDLRFSAYLTASDKALAEARLSILQDLVADARQRADVLARLSGFSLGPVESISDSFYPIYSYGVFSSQGFVYSFTVSIMFGRK